MNADDTTGNNTPRQTSGMDTEAFLALNAEFLASHAPNGSGTSAGSPSSQAPVSPHRPTASSAQPGTSSRQGQPDATMAINPLVAARAAGASKTESGTGAAGAASSSPAATGPFSTGELYPVADVAQARSIDVSFNERRRAGRVVLTVVIVLAVVAVAAAAAYFVLRGQTRTAVDQGISDAWGSLAVADVVVGPMADAIDNEVNNATLDPALSDVLMSSQVATGALNDAESAVDFQGLRAMLMTDEQKDAVSAVHSAVDGRRNMVSLGRQLLVNDASASKALSSLQDAYDQIAQANAQYQASYDASVAAQSEEGETVDLASIVEADNAALTAVNAAADDVADAKLNFPTADYSGIDAYLSAAKDAYTNLVALDTATLNGDADAEAAASDPYYQALAQLEAAAANLPADAQALIGGAYGEATSQYSSGYSSASKMIEASDADVRAYLSSAGMDADQIASRASDGVTLPASSTSSAADSAAAGTAAGSAATEGAGSSAVAEAAGTAVPAGQEPADAAATDQEAVEETPVDAAGGEAAGEVTDEAAA